MISVTFIGGLPGSGKTTFRHNMLKANPDAVALSCDDFIESTAKSLKKNYSDIFYHVIGESVERFHDDLDSYMHRGEKNIIVDSTFLTPDERSDMMTKFLAYTKDIEFCIYYFVVDRSLTWLRNEERKIFGRDLPDNVLSDMIQREKHPTQVEMFSDLYIVYADSESIDIDHVVGTKVY